MQGLNFILANKSRVMVLRTLFEAEQPLSGRAVEKKCGLSNRATMCALEILVEARAVHREKNGRSHLYTINHNNYFVDKVMETAFEAEELLWDDLRKTVRRTVRPRPLAAVATGPLAREENDYGGKLILTMLFPSGRSRIRSLSSMTNLAEAVRDRYGMILEHHLMDINTMDKGKYLPIWRRVEREGILLFGTLP